ncbi:MAG: hypothetical protein KKA73_26920 [Chloroflexi bacterium]|nr:hypothetical protein [Chloroflexota bacterium]MBU1751333.1 hypothetical protein [Chloroflexota bacterium]
MVAMFYLGLKDGVTPLDLDITSLDLLAIEIVGFQSPLEGEEMLRAVIAPQGLRDLILAVGTARVAGPRQFVGVALPSDDIADDAQAHHPISSAASASRVQPSITRSSFTGAGLETSTRCPTPASTTPQ